MPVIAKVTGREILDSRGNPTVEATVVLDNGIFGRAAVPSGASTGAHEALELRDGVSRRYGGKGALKAVKYVNTELAHAVAGIEATAQRRIDEIMIAADGSKNKSRLGANAILAVSLAAARAGAGAMRLPLYQYLRQVFTVREKSWRLPLPMMNVLNGGRHADNNLSIQEFMIVPRQREFRERVRVGSQIFHALGDILREKGYHTGVGDEGGYAPELSNNEHALKFLVSAIKSAGFIPGKQVSIALDLASSEFYRGGKYYFFGKAHASGADKIIRTLKEWREKYPLVSAEDPLAEDDWDNWVKLTKELDGNLTVVGDDLFVTQVERISRGVELGAANAVLVKPNQVGTLSETMDAIRLARDCGLSVIVSHRSGETADTFIADLSAAVNAEFVKTGSLSRSERVEKYNRLMEIASEVGE